MQAQKHRAWYLVLLVLGIFACADDSEPAPNPGSGAGGLPGSSGTLGGGGGTLPGANGTLPGASGTLPSAGSNGQAGGSTTGATTSSTSSSTVGGSTDAGAAATTVQDGGGSSSQPKADGGATPNQAGGPTGTGPLPMTDGGTTPAVTPAEIPTPVSAPYVWGLGIGITDVPAAVKFYTEVMKMTVEKQAIKRDDRTETVLYASQAKRGARLVLMNFDDKRSTQKITAKLVWQASNTGAVNSAASKYPGYVSRLNFGIVQFDGPETYIHEVGSIFDSGGNGITVPYLIVAGFSVSDLPAARRFYAALGMEVSSTGSFGVTDATGTGNITEYTAKYATGSGVVLQEWSPKRNSKDNPIKVVIFVPDAKAMADKIVAAGGSIAKAAERTAVYDNRLLIVAKDSDGYVLELVQ